ncbi:TRMT1-like protein isoform X2 [Anabrus simplex]|uniref:TRMT1-like protein isoform X2 n=1 Tax=Anabrus simplex TaxID=316456 RepID=UPI0035A28BBF
MMKVGRQKCKERQIQLGELWSSSVLPSESPRGLTLLVISYYRAIVTTALAAYKKMGTSAMNPIQCLDGIGTTGICGLLWQKYIGDGIKVDIVTHSSKACDRILENAKLNNLTVNVCKVDTCVQLHQHAYNFISLNCHTGAARHFDSIFRNLPKSGIIAITTTDDATLYGITPEIALRNYGGVIARTMYSKELAIRLFTAAMARAAARYNKGLRMLFCVSLKSSFTVVATVERGATHANTSLSQISRLVHCNMCEDRAFYPLSKFPVENPSSLLECGCPSKFTGKIAIELGPVWSGELFDVAFLNAMLNECKQLPWSHRAGVLLQQIICEAKCSTSGSENVPPVMQDKADKGDSNVGTPPAKRMKLDDLANITPPFYYNLHRHAPKGPQLIRLDKAVQCLQRAGFRASRTHFDPEAVKTNASLKELKEVLMDYSKCCTK